MKIKEKMGNIPIPSWLFALGTVLYCETVFYLWTAKAFSAGRFAVVLAFSLGFGAALGEITSFFGHRKWGKWVSVAMMTLVTALYIVEYFVSDAYVTFMPMGTLLGGAKGVMTDFITVVLDVVVRGFWRILVMLLPCLAYALLAKPVTVTWRLRGIVLALALAGYLGGFLIVRTVGTDSARLDSAYHFDSAIRCFGLNMGFTLDALHGGGEKSGSFAPVEASTLPTETREKPGEETPEETAPVIWEPNVMDFDFEALAQNEKNSRVANIHKYLATVEPTMKNQYTGLFKGKNLILITAEAFSREAIDPELTPTLYRLANEGIRFDDFYQPMWGGSTSSGEFSVLTGLVSASGTNSIKESRQQELFLAMGKQLQKQGYYSAAYHNHLYNFYDRDKTHTYYGYDTYMGMHNGMEKGVQEQWPESDLEMMEFTVPQYIDHQPFSIYYMTVSGHCRYNFLGNAMSKKNSQAVENLEYSNTVKAYFASQLELEYAMASLVSQLEEAGIADDTVIVLTADHYPYGLEPGDAWNNDKDYVAELYGYDPQNHVERDHNALIVWSGCLEGMGLAVEEPTYSLDILPTLSNLFGLEYDSRLLVGRDVFSDAEPIVLWYDYTWKTDKGIYNSENQTFTPAEGVEVDQDYIQRIKNIVSNKIFYSREVQDVDYFNYLWKEISGE